MANFPSALRRAVFVVLGIALLAVAGPIPARAQIMHDDGVPLPWFHNRAQQLARQACENDLPECRDSVRRQLATEKMITTLAPWVLLCVVIFGAMRYVRYQENKREGRRHQAERQHTRAVRTKPQRGSDGDDGPRTEAADDDDELGFGHPGDKH